MPDWALLVSQPLEFTIKKLRTRTVVCSDIPALHPLFFPLELPGHRAMAPSIASTTPAAVVSYTKRCLSHALSRTRCTLREMVLITSVSLGVFILSKATSCDVHAASSWHVSAKFHLSQLIDTSMFHDVQCKAELRKRLRTHTRSSGTPMKKKVYDLQLTFRAIRAFGRSRKGPVPPWILRRKVVQLGGPIRGFMHNAKKRSKTLFMSPFLTL